MGTASRCHFLKNYIHVYIFLAFLTQLGYFQIKIKVRKNIYYARRFGRGVGGGGGGEGGGWLRLPVLAAEKETTVFIRLTALDAY